jgi:dihydropteridine reductase
LGCGSFPCFVDFFGYFPATNPIKMWRRTTAVWSSAANYTFKQQPKKGLVRAPFVPEEPISGGSKKTALVVGSSGTLGRAIVQELQEKHNMKVLQADVVGPSSATLLSSSASRSGGGGDSDDDVAFCDLSQSTSLADLTVNLATGVSNFLQLDQGETLDVVVCAAGGWTGNPPLQSPHIHDSMADEMTAQAILYAETIDRMRQVNLDPVLATAYLLQARFLSRDSLMVVMGATAALQPTPDMIGYGLAKAATHSAVQTFAAQTTTSLETKSVRDRSSLYNNNNIYPTTILGLLPTTLDTPTNRASMTYSPTWTSPHVIATQIGEWVQSPALRPHSGALIKVFTNDQGATTFSIVR